MGVGSVLVSLFLPSLSPHPLRNLVSNVRSGDNPRPQRTNRRLEVISDTCVPCPLSPIGDFGRIFTWSSPTTWFHKHLITFLKNGRFMSAQIFRCGRFSQSLVFLVRLKRTGCHIFAEKYDQEPSHLSFLYQNLCQKVKRFSKIMFECSWEALNNNKHVSKIKARGIHFINKSFYYSYLTWSS